MEITRQIGILLYQYQYERTSVKIYMLYDFLVEVLEDAHTTHVLKVEPSRHTDLYFASGMPVAIPA